MERQNIIKQRLKELREENLTIQRRRNKSDQDEIDRYRDARRGLGSRVNVEVQEPRWWKRLGAAGTPRSVIFIQKMSIPGTKRRKK